MNRCLKWSFFSSLALALLLGGAAFYTESMTVLTDTAIAEETVCDLSDLPRDDELTIQVRFFCDPDTKIKPATLLRSDNGLQVRFNEKRALEVWRNTRCFARHTIPSATGVRRFTLHYVGGKLELFQNHVSPLTQMLEHPFACGPAAGLFPHKLWVIPSPGVQIRQLTIRTGNWENTIFFLKAFAVFFGITAAGCCAASLAGGNAVPRNTEPDIVCTAAIAAFGITAFLLLCAAAFYFPEVRAPDLSCLLVSAATTCPEPKEHFLYLLSLLCGGTFTLGVTWYAAHKKILIPGAQYFAFAVLLIFCGSAVKLHFCQFSGVFYGLAATLGTAGILTFRRDRRLEKTMAFFCGAAGACFLGVWAIRLFQMPCTIEFLHHYCAVIHSLYMAAYGYIPFADFQSQYGLYPLFLAPFFRILPVNFVSINTVFLLLALITAGAFFRLLRRCCRSVFLPIPGTAAILALYAGLPYLQQFPVRLVFPALLLWFVRYESDAPSTKRAFCGTVLASLALLWSPDTGAVLLIAHTLFLGFTVWEQERQKPFAEKLLSLLKMAVHQFSALVLTILLFLGTCQLLAGKIPDLRLLFQYSMVFGKTGFFSLPMPVFGAWLIPAAVYCTGLCFSFVRLLSGNREDPWKARFVFFCSLLGCGIASYYVGRSHDDCLPAILYPMIVLLTLFADSGTGRNRCWRLLLLTVLLFPLFRALILLPQHRFTAKEQEQMQTTNEFCRIMRKRVKREKFLALLPMGTYYAIRMGAEPLCGCTSFEESLFREEAERTLKRLLEDRTLQGIGIVAAGNYKTCPSAKKLTDFVARRTGQNLPKNALLYLTLPLERLDCQKYRR